MIQEYLFTSDQYKADLENLSISYQEVVQTHGQISFPEVLRKEKAL